MNLSIIIVNWNVCELLRHCLASIEANRGNLSLEVIVVDNASSDSSVAMVKEEFPQAQLVASHENLGYARGNNLGATKAMGRYLLILNPDTEIVGDAIEQMISYLEEHPNVGAVGPQLLNPDRSIQPSRRRFPRIPTAFFVGTPLSWRWTRDNNRFARRHNMADRPDNETQPVDWLIGAALMIRRGTWQEVGSFDEQFFMYSDEVDWCLRCHSAGWEVHYLPTAKIIHDEHKSASQVPIASRVHFHRSRILYLRKHFGAGWAIVLRLHLLMNYAWLLTEEAFKWAVGRRHDTRRQRMLNYWFALKSILR